MGPAVCVRGQHLRTQAKLKPVMNVAVQTPCRCELGEGGSSCSSACAVSATLEQPVKQLLCKLPHVACSLLPSSLVPSASCYKHIRVKLRKTISDISLLCNDGLSQ